MKTNRIELTKWLSDDDVIDIDWPVIHRRIGKDHLDWLLKQPKHQCQLVVEKCGSDRKLIAEFYDDHTLLGYHMMWS